ncbi:MAG TPA: hypothetical protein VKU60_14870, partial [Chloroflexota bacterium]|nr:hypothetical protein [Chloroflexota bacterium]
MALDTGKALIAAGLADATALPAGLADAAGAVLTAGLAAADAEAGAAALAAGLVVADDGGAAAGAATPPQAVKPIASSETSPNILIMRMSNASL